MQVPVNLSRRQRKVAKVLGFAALAIVTFLITLHLTFPYERVKTKLVELLSEKYDVTIASVGPGLLPGQAVFEKIILRTRPTKPGEKPTEIIIDELEVDLGLDFNLFALIRKKAVIDFEAQLGGGVLEGYVDAGKSLVATSLNTRNLALNDIPGVADAVGLPMSGQIDATVNLRLPGGKWQNAEGKIALDCEMCTVGDGKAKMELNPRKRRGRRSRAAVEAWGKQGVTVPRLQLGEAEVRIDISKGIGEIKKFAAKSPDGWFDITGQIEFRDPFKSSMFPGCMKFKLSDELKKREPDFGNIEFTMSEKTRQADGSFAVPTKGRLTQLRWDLKRSCGGGVLDGDDETDGPPSLASRPTLDGTADDGDEADDNGGTAAGSGAVQADPDRLPGITGDGAEPAAAGMPEPGESGPNLSGAPAGQLRDGGADTDDDRDREDDYDERDDVRDNRDSRDLPDEDGEYRDDDEYPDDHNRDDEEDYEDPRDKVVD